MSQINLHTTPEFEQQLKEYMEITGVQTKAQAIRAAVQESLTRRLAQKVSVDFTRWIGEGLTPVPRQPRFKDEDDLWESKQ